MLQYFSILLKTPLGGEETPYISVVLFLMWTLYPSHFQKAVEVDFSKVTSAIKSNNY